MDEIAGLPERDRSDLFRIVADGAEAALGYQLSPGVVEKDFWVCWLMRKLFRLRFAMPSANRPRMLFKGGTSLAKAFGLIQRFSEDVDVSVEPEELPVDRSPLDDPDVSNARRKKIGEAVTTACGIHVAERVLPDLADAVEAVLGAGPWLLPEGPDDPSIVRFPYPRATELDGALLPEVRLEFGARADLHPWQERTIRPYVWEVRPDVFGNQEERAFTQVPTLEAERTFWEKVTLLHVENLRAARKPVPPPRAWNRISRHAYDLVMLMKGGVAERAIPDAALFARVCETKHLWFRSSFSDYDELSREKVRIVPRYDLKSAFSRDYAAMGSMFFAEPPPEEELLEALRLLEARIRSGR